VVVLEGVPLGLGSDLLGGCGIDDYSIGINNCCEPGAISLPHFVVLSLDHEVALALDSFSEVLGVRRITNASEEFDSLLSFKILETSVFLDEFGLVLS